MTKSIHSLTKSVLRRMGIELLRTRNVPSETLLGLRGIPFRTVIDIGANTGQFAREASANFPGAAIICFEPVPQAYRDLECWARRQDGRVAVFPVALGEREGSIQMYYHTGHSASSSLLPTTQICEELYPQTSEQVLMNVKVTSLDKAVSRIQGSLIPEVLIKMDVQGFEDRVILGARETLEKTRACIVEVNLDPLYEGQAEFSHITTALSAHGLRYAGNIEQSYGKDGHAVFVDALFLRPWTHHD